MTDPQRFNQPVKLIVSWQQTCAKSSRLPAKAGAALALQIGLSAFVPFSGRAEGHLQLADQRHHVGFIGGRHETNRGNMMRTLTSLRGSAIVLTASLALLATPSLQSAHAQEDVVTPALQEFNTLVRENTDNENIINLAQRISVVCPQLTVSFDEDFDVTNPDFTTSVDAGREAGTVEGDLVGRCTGAILTTLGGDIDGGLNILGQLAGEETLGLDTVVSGLNRSQTQVVAARLGAFTAGSAARSVVAETDRPVILASVSYPNAIQSGGTATDANGMAGAFSDETDLGMGWSGYVNGYFSFGEQDPTQLEAGFDFDSYSLSIGADRSVGQRSMLGAALTVGQTDVEFEANAGDTETMAVSISGYGATNFTDQLSA